MEEQEKNTTQFQESKPVTTPYYIPENIRPNPQDGVCAKTGVKKEMEENAIVYHIHPRPDEARHMLNTPVDRGGDAEAIEHNHARKRIKQEEAERQENKEYMYRSSLANRSHEELQSMVPVHEEMASSQSTVESQELQAGMHNNKTGLDYNPSSYVHQESRDPERYSQSSYEYQSEDHFRHNRKPSKEEVMESSYYPDWKKEHAVWKEEHGGSVWKEEHSEAFGSAGYQPEIIRSSRSTNSPAKPFQPQTHSSFYQMCDLSKSSHVPYECSLCGEKFVQTYDFTNHLYLHMDNMICTVLNTYK